MNSTKSGSTPGQLTWVVTAVSVSTGTKTHLTTTAIRERLTSKTIVAVLRAIHGPGATWKFSMTKTGTGAMCRNVEKKPT